MFTLFLGACFNYNNPHICLILSHLSLCHLRATNSYDRNLHLDQQLTVLTDLNNYNAPPNQHILNNHHSYSSLNQTDQSINVAIGTNNQQQSSFDQSSNQETKYLLQLQSTRDHHQPTYSHDITSGDNYNTKTNNNQLQQFCDLNQYSNHSDNNNITTTAKYHRPQEEKSLISVIRTAKNKKRKLTTDKSATTTTTTTQSKDNKDLGGGQDYTQNLITQHHQHYPANNNNNSTSRFVDVGGAYSPTLSISDSLTSSAIHTDAKGTTGNNNNNDGADVKGSANSKNKQQQSTTGIAISTNTEEAQLR